MVAPFTSGRIARSMVRIPGSGTDDNAVPICQNLGNVSNFAAMISVPQTLSFNNQNRRVQVESSSSTLKQHPVNMPNIEERSASPLANDRPTDKLEDFTVESPRPISINVPFNTTQTMDSTAVRNSDVSASSSTTRPSSGDKNTSSRLKRISREDNAENCDASTSPKRYRISPPTHAQGTAQMNWVLPNGMLMSSGSTPSIPIVLPVANGSNMSLAMPMGMVQLNNQTPSVILANGSMNGTSSPAFVLQASGSNTAAAGSNTAATATPQVPNSQSTPVLMMPTQSLPLLFSSVPNRDLQQIAQERNQLKKENESLKYRLSRFHHLLRNKEKLMTVLRNLEAVKS